MFDLDKKRMKKFRISGKIIIIIVTLLSLLSFAFTSCTNYADSDSNEKITTYRVKFYDLKSIGWNGTNFDYTLATYLTFTWSNKTVTYEEGTYIDYIPSLSSQTDDLLRYHNLSFIGWYLESSYTTEFIGRVDKDLILYARYNGLDYGTKQIKIK